MAFAGSYGVVCSAMHKETGTVRAVKELKKSKKNQEKNELLLKEFHILKRLDHPNILKMYGEYSRWLHGSIRCG
jgi:calcium-dependent protein kinase